MTRKPLFWISYVILAAFGIYFAYTYFPRAYPIVSLNLQMHREMALERARELAQANSWGTETYRQAASFKADTRVQHFVELEAGGVEAFRKMMQEGLYQPYTWRVRHFKEGETHETLVRFQPNGIPYGFVEKLAEADSGASVAPDSAQAIAEAAVAQHWSESVDLSNYECVEKSREERPGGRIDHTLVYERTDARIGEGKYRLRLVVGGDRLTELTHFVKIPEAFVRRYEEMRSANNTIASISVIGMALLYGIGGCIIGLFFLLRQRWVLWKKAFYWGFFISFLLVLAQINRLPLEWMDYDTALSVEGFILNQIVGMLALFLGMGGLFTLSFMTAESLTRKAFPEHIRFWQMWSPDVASSTPVLGRTVGGFLFVALFFAFDIGLYFFATKVLGWWTPSEALVEPDVLATYFPWLSSIAISLQAGFWEECFFRAIPIAGAALIGQKLGNRRLWIIAAFVLQALIFGAGHANYPQQPSYARVVELIIPSIAFGLIYLYFGLLPAIILHFAVDVIWFALPLFVSTAPGIWMNQTLVVVITFIPLWIVLRARLKKKRWLELGEDGFNRSWQPPEKPEATPDISEETPEISHELSPMISRLLIVAGVIALVVWFFTSAFDNAAPDLTVSRSAAEKLARNELSARGIRLPDNWKALSNIQEPAGSDDRFVWQSGTREDYKKLMGSYLALPRWRIRFAVFEGDVAERAEEYQVFVTDSGTVSRFRHKLPEARAGATLTIDQARAIAHSELIERYHLQPGTLREISATPSKLQSRMDWEFIFADTLGYSLPQGEARIAVEIAGDERVDAYRFIHVPEDWERNEKNERNLYGIIRFLCVALIIVLFVGCAIISIISWSNKKFSVSIFALAWGVIFGIEAIGIINGWSGTIAEFSTAEPLSNQTFTAIAFSILRALFFSGGLALIIGFLHRWLKPYSARLAGGTLATGWSLGALMAALVAIVNLAGPSLIPAWADYRALDAYLPWLEIGSSSLALYILRGILFMIIFAAIHQLSKGWTTKKIGSAFVLIIIGLALAGLGRIDSTIFWLGSGIIIGIALLLSYIFILRYHLALIPLAVALMVVLASVKHAIIGAFPDAVPGAVLAAILILILSIFWHKKLSISS
ncbi:CPBP family intramembrane metalloprotease [candidate division KSB1 bacterium]|nr:CPBP family intramembrane metalloprotease [candidate division KSB1 bacterium]